MKIAVLVVVMVSPPHFCTLCKPCASLTFVFMADQAPSTAGLGAPVLFIDPEVLPRLSFDVSCILKHCQRHNGPEG